MSRTADFTVTSGELEFQVRQLPSGHTGVTVYKAAIDLLDYLQTLRDWQDVCVLELGAGTGALSIGLAKLGARVFATDCDKATLKNMRYNVHQTGVSGRVQCLMWDWSESPPDALPFDRIQYCIGSDLAYGTSATAALSQAVLAVKERAPDAICLFSLEERQAGAVGSFYSSLQELGFNASRRLLTADVEADEKGSDDVAQDEDAFGVWSMSLITV
eukprot:TRINITY_DN90699_c0_g1_i1.p1 TRINITY_DN90699_c0_g1~~TRINITY_DN90699_c0_g1_i1.p1  ORF type:complete len:238 (-),score=28.20 TRINITY_DN90699_c0_g1_i1:212-859(-)